MIHNRVWALGVILAMAFASLSEAMAIDSPERPSRDDLRRMAVRENESFWKSIATREPSGKTGCRKIIGYALMLAEVGEYPDRLGRLFSLLAHMQDRRPGSKTFGNLKWTWQDKGVTDQNAVEFCMQDALLLWSRHRAWIPEPAQRQLWELMQYGVEGCLRHKVPTSYTNIAITHAGNLIVLGHTLGRASVTEQGDRRLGELVALTAASGIHEFCSPTYYGIDLNGLNFIATLARQPDQRRQAESLLQLFWSDIAYNWFPAAQRLGGAYSRTYDLLSGLGALDWYTWVNGWFDGPSPGKAERVEPYWNEWTPPAQLRQNSLSLLPRLVRQSWGERLGESRTQMLYPDITLSCIGAEFGREDVPLAIDLAGPRESPRAYFIADGRNDPYGKKKFKSHPGSHVKATHLTPFWIGAQRTGDALVAAVYRNKDLQVPEITDLKSHLVLRRDVQAIWLDGQPVDTSRLATPAGVPLTVGQPLVLRYGTAAIGVRVLAATTRDSRAAGISLLDDGNSYDCIRLTIHHGLEETSYPKTNSFPLAAAGLWVRVGSGLNDDAAFDAWRRQFDTSLPARVEFTPSQALMEVPGTDGPVALRAMISSGQLAAQQIVPEPSRAVLEVNGQDIGRPLLENTSPNTATVSPERQERR